MSSIDTGTDQSLIKIETKHGHPCAKSRGLILGDCSQIYLVSEVSGVKAKLFHKLSSGGGGKVRKEEEETDVK